MNYFIPVLLCVLCIPAISILIVFAAANYAYAKAEIDALCK